MLSQSFLVWFNGTGMNYRNTLLVFIIHLRLSSSFPFHNSYSVNPEKIYVFMYCITIANLQMLQYYIVNTNCQM